MKVIKILSTEFSMGAKGPLVILIHSSSVNLLFGWERTRLGVWSCSNHHYCYHRRNHLNKKPAGKENKAKQK
jgi:hypothetical protein